MSTTSFKEELKSCDFLYVIQNKLAANDKFYKYSITPEPLDGWFDAVEEARGYGIPISSFGDTSDKIVITPTHFTEKDVFNYSWGRGFWTNERCWSRKISDEERMKVYNKMSEFINICNKYYDIGILDVSGSEKGYLSSTLVKYDKLTDNLGSTFIKIIGEDFRVRDFVIFIYGLDSDIMKEMIS